MYKLPTSLRQTLATPFGPVHQTREAVGAARAARIVVAVGDVVTQTFLDHGILPRLMVVDGVTQRGTKVEAALHGLPRGVRQVRARNPPAEITHELVEAIERALESDDSTVITVQGEEDLAALPAMILAPDGALVCYGQPHEGVVVVVVTSAVRERAKDILKQMEV